MVDFSHREGTLAVNRRSTARNTKRHASDTTYSTHDSPPRKGKAPEATSRHINLHTQQNTTRDGSRYALRKGQSTASAYTERQVQYETQPPSGLTVP